MHFYIINEALIQNKYQPPSSKKGKNKRRRRRRKRRRMDHLPEYYILHVTLEHRSLALLPIISESVLRITKILP